MLLGWVPPTTSLSALAAEWTLDSPRTSLCVPKSITWASATQDRRSIARESPLGLPFISNRLARKLGPCVAAPRFCWIRRRAGKRTFPAHCQNTAHLQCSYREWQSEMYA